MKKLFLGTALMLISATGGLYAQNDETPNYIKRMNMSKTQLTFNANENLFGIRDFVVLKEGRLILEMAALDDYESFRNLDSILLQFIKDIAFYKDSLDADPTGNVRIDYVLNPEYSFKKIRFKKYPPDGNIFLNQEGTISKLKFEQDTIRLIIQKSRPGIGRKKSVPCSIPYSIQATFILGNYYDINKVIADNVLKEIVDTLEKTSQTEKTLRHKDAAWYMTLNPLSIVYNPYYIGKGGLKKYDWLLANEYDVWPKNHKVKFISVNANLGVGIIRNTLAPMGDIGLQYNKFLNNFRDHNLFRISATPYCFFDKDQGGKYTLNDNWFVNASIGSIYDHFLMKGWTGKECTIGFGYLIAEKGGYFKNTTFKIFTDILYTNNITIVPEFIFTDNSKQIFPGITVKIF